MAFPCTRNLCIAFCVTAVFFSDFSLCGATVDVVTEKTDGDVKPVNEGESIGVIGAGDVGRGAGFEVLEVAMYGAVDEDVVREAAGGATEGGISRLGDDTGGTAARDLDVFAEEAAFVEVMFPPFVDSFLTPSESSIKGSFAVASLSSDARSYASTPSGPDFRSK